MQYQRIAVPTLTSLTLAVLLLSGLRPAAADEPLSPYPGWYTAQGGRHLTVLPGKDALTAVFFWRATAPTSVGVIKQSDAGEAIFWQPVDTQPLNAKKDGDRVVSVTVVESEFKKRCDLANAVGTYVSKKNPIMQISLREGQLYCSIDWKNGAPQTNGWIRAGANGQTILEGYGWTDNLELKFGDNSITSIGLVGQKFIHFAEPATADKSSEPSEKASR